MILHVQPLLSTPPTHISHHPHRLHHCHPICIFQCHLFLSMSSPSSPHSPACQVFCYCHLLIHSSSLAITANACHSWLYPSPSACRAQLHASWAPAQDHALEELVDTGCRTFFTHFRMFHRHPFVLVLALPFSPFSFVPFIGLQAISPSFQRRTHHCIANLYICWPQFEHWTYYRMTSHSLSPSQLELHLLQSLFPCLLTLAYKVQTVPVDSKLYKYHRLASLNSRQLQPTSPLFLSYALLTTTHSTLMLRTTPLRLRHLLLIRSSAKVSNGGSVVDAL